jgi:hypothetical protein
MIVLLMVFWVAPYNSGMSRDWYCKNPDFDIHRVSNIFFPLSYFIQL